MRALHQAQQTMHPLSEEEKRACKGAMPCDTYTAAGFLLCLFCCVGLALFGVSSHIFSMNRNHTASLFQSRNGLLDDFFIPVLRGHLVCITSETDQQAQVLVRVDGGVTHCCCSSRSFCPTQRRYSFFIHFSCRILCAWDVRCLLSPIAYSYDGPASHFCFATSTVYLRHRVKLIAFLPCVVYHVALFSVIIFFVFGGQVIILPVSLLCPVLCCTSGWEGVA